MGWPLQDSVGESCPAGAVVVPGGVRTGAVESTPDRGWFGVFCPAGDCLCEPSGGCPVGTVDFDVLGGAARWRFPVCCVELFRCVLLVRIGNDSVVGVQVWVGVELDAVAQAVGHCSFVCEAQPGFLCPRACFHDGGRH